MSNMKIKDVFKRDGKKEGTGKLIDGEFADPAFETLKDTVWVWREYLNGVSIRLVRAEYSDYIDVLGEDDDTPLDYNVESDVIEAVEYVEDVIIDAFATIDGEITMYCKYIEVDGEEKYRLVLYDIQVENMWMSETHAAKIAELFEFDSPPVLFESTLSSAVSLMGEKVYKSEYYQDDNMFGMVGAPASGLLRRDCSRIVTKMEASDFISVDAPAVSVAAKEEKETPASTTAKSA